MPPPRHSKGAAFDVKRIDGVSRRPKDAVSRRPEPPRRFRDDGAIRESIVQDLLRSVVVDETEQVTLARHNPEPEPFMPPRAELIPTRRRFIPAVLRTRPNPWSLVPFLVVAVIVIAGLLVISNRGLKVKEEVVEDGRAAVGHLMSARAAVERFDFAAASDDFTRAYEEFGRARDDLGLFNTRMGMILAKLPGGGQIDSAQRLIQAGQLLAKAGGNMSDLVSALAESGSILDPANNGRTSFVTVLLPMQEALTEASEHITVARELLAGVDAEDIPEEQRAEFRELAGRLPELEQLIEHGAAYVRFLEDVIAGTGNRTYLLLFQNTSELRPTGGFPGSFGVAIFTDGRLLSFEADDVYNPDGQIDDLIVPPRALQHITPGWGLRDSTWFADFPSSADKAIEMYEIGSGRRVDGVIAVTPRIIKGLLEISGPVSMPDYDLVLDADDFMPKLQAQVEYGLDKQDNKPKKIIMEMAPIILRKLYQAPKGEWLKVLGVLSEGLKHKDIMMYFTDERIQRFVYDEGFDGRVHQGDEDFMMVTVANVAGGKADAVTDTAMKLDSALTADGVEHALTISRRHDGGTSEYGFYNTANPAYVRVLVPEGSTFRSISGNAKKGFRSVTSYANAVYDPDLDALESSAVYLQEQDVTLYEESGRTAFGFWLVVEPGQTREVRLRWTTPSEFADRDYELYVQRQPGLDVRNFEWTVSAGPGARLLSSSPALVPVRDLWRLRSGLETDLSVSASFE